MRFTATKVVQIILGFSVSFVFLYLTFSKVNFRNLSINIEELNFVYLCISLILVLLSLFMRSLRWSNILNSIISLNQKILFPISSVGISAITILPLRLGEVVRPYLLSRDGKVPFSSAFASIVFEKILDTIMIVVVLSVVIIFSSVPIWVINAGVGLFISISTFLLFLVLVFLYQEKSAALLSELITFLPEKYSDPIQNIFLNFLKGLAIFSNPKDIFMASLTSILLWVTYGLIVYSMFLFHSFNLSFIAAYTVVVITFLATSLPAAPGFLGTFQYGCFLALTNYGIAEENAAFFSITYYFVMVGTNVIVGLLFLPIVNLDKGFLSSKN
jgi:glycosyltransferase 2 family protein